MGNKTSETDRGLTHRDCNAGKMCFFIVKGGPSLLTDVRIKLSNKRENKITRLQKYPLPCV